MAQRPDRAAPSTEAHPPTGWVRLGRLGRPFQLQGELRLRSLGPGADAAALELGRHGAAVWLSGVGPIRLRASRRVGGGVVLAFQGAYSPERARLHVHRELWVEPSAVAMEGDADEIAVELLEGAEVRVDGRPYGRVVEVRTEPQELLLVEGPDGPRWVPWAAPYVDWDGAAIDIVDPPSGLLDDG